MDRHPGLNRPLSLRERCIPIQPWTECKSVRKMRVSLVLDLLPKGDPIKTLRLDLDSLRVESFGTGSPAEMTEVATSHDRSCIISCPLGCG